ncbi:hypothetical protein KKD81_02425 [Patescibacteria group bacterium]|nr:hypothetical protein [Patescibacteria group bacterium]MBU2220772.1 hypothetical protein [Patescibacteria group bacterium]
MPILKALGLGVCILVLKLLVPQIFTELEQTALIFLRGAQTSALVATDLAASVGTIEFSQEPFVLPQATPIK